ncbi:hypothetical protein KA405_04895 [Patescibacteria group bacterium]|nr:hypothetical protein [Patescibacteria group bacterium]
MIVHWVVKPSARSDSTLTLIFPSSLLICATEASGLISTRSQIRTNSPRGVLIIRLVIFSGVTLFAKVSYNTFIVLSSQLSFTVHAFAPLIAADTSLAACA